MRLIIISFAGIALSVNFLSCGNDSSIIVKKDTATVNIPVKDVADSFPLIEGANVKSDDYWDNQETPFLCILGCWAAIRKEDVTISFYTDTSFVFYDYNSKIKEEEELKGKFEVDDSVLTLFYNDRPRQRFIFKKDTNDVPRYYIQGGPSYFFRRSNCP
jgi:hypothetical protein